MSVIDIISPLSTAVIRAKYSWDLAKVVKSKELHFTFSIHTNEYVDGLLVQRQFWRSCGRIFLVELFGALTNAPTKRDALGSILCELKKL